MVSDKPTTERIQQILNDAESALKSIIVEKPIPLELDVGNLISNDNNSLHLGGEDTNDYLKSIARDNIQALLAKVWELPTSNEEGMIYAALPAGTTRLPREKPLPKGTRITKWEAYAREKGFNRRKKTKKVWDDTLQKWIPRFGYLKVQAEKEKNWVKEVPGNADPYEDQFEKASLLKKENIAKNEYKRLKNIARGHKIKIPGVGNTGSKFASSKDLGLATHSAHHATASIGKFQKRVDNENPKKIKAEGKKRKSTDFNINPENEKRRNLEIIDKINKPELNIAAAINKQIREENYEMSHAGRKLPDRRSKAGTKKRGKSELRTLGKGKPPVFKKGGAKKKSGDGNAVGRGVGRGKGGGAVAGKKGGGSAGGRGGSKRKSLKKKGKKGGKT